MSVVATGDLMKPMQGLAVLVAACDQFQADVAALAGAEQTAAAALAFVHYPEADDASIRLPRAIIRFAPGFMTRKKGEGTWDSEGVLELSFEYPVEMPEGSEAEQLAMFANRLGTVVENIRDLAGKGDAGDGESHLNVIEISDPYGFGKTNLQTDSGETSGDPFMSACFTVRWEGGGL